jgi:predicted O-methyltransferase YrrM
MLELIGKPDYLTISNPTPAAAQILAVLAAAGITEPVVAELGVGIGATSLTLARCMNNAGKLHLFDFHDKLGELEADLALFGFTNVECFGNTSKHWDSYNWTLGKFLLAGQRAVYDYIYLDGSHTFVVDGLAFVLCDMLLKPGGFIEVDDYYWKFSQSQWMKEIRHDFMTDEQINTAQLAMVVDLFLNGNPQYEVITQNRIYRKRPAKAVF